MNVLSDTGGRSSALSKINKLRSLALFKSRIWKQISKGFIELNTLTECPMERKRLSLGVEAVAHSLQEEGQRLCREASGRPEAQNWDFWW